MPLGRWLRNALALPGTAHLNLDAVSTTESRAAIVQRKPFLCKLYSEWYERLTALTRDAPAGPRVEIGSGPGFFKRRLPGLIATEVQHVAHIDAVADATALPFRSRSVAVVYGIDVFHHLQAPARFLESCARVLQPGGEVALIEPWNSPWGRFVWQRFHHEPFDPRAGWELPGRAPLSEANGALPWIVFTRDRARFEGARPELQLRAIRPFMPLAYVMSGGVSMSPLLPGWAYQPWRAAESMLGPLNHALGMFALIHLKRREEPAP